MGVTFQFNMVLAAMLYKDGPEMIKEAIKTGVFPCDYIHYAWITLTNHWVQELTTIGDALQSHQPSCMALGQWTFLNVVQQCLIHCQTEYHTGDEAGDTTLGDMCQLKQLLHLWQGCNNHGRVWNINARVPP